jgi:hypothetical protein
MTMPAEPGFDERVEAALAQVPAWRGRTTHFRLAAAPVASPTHRAVASDCVRVRVDGADPVFLKVRHADMVRDVLPAMPEATRWAGRLGLGPKVLVEAEGVLGLVDLPEPWRYARVGDLQDAGTMAQVLGTLRRLHAAEALGQDFCPFARIEGLAQEARACAAPLPEDIDALLASARLIRAAIHAAGFDRAFCRNDGTASNLMLDPAPGGGVKPDGVRLVDFDLAGDNDPWFEVGALLALFHRCRLYGAVDDLMWGLWGVTRAVTSRRPGIEFFKYGQWRLLHARTTIAARDFELWLRHL